MSVLSRYDLTNQKILSKLDQLLFNPYRRVNDDGAPCHTPDLQSNL